MTTQHDPASSASLGSVCLNCSHEQAGMEPCERCGSVRVVLVTVVRKLFGDDWRDVLTPEPEAP